MSYLYETHLHTSQISACGESRGREYIRGYKQLGYTGIIVTDHFYRGNCTVNRNLPWREWVNQYCRGFEDARNEGARQGLDVFFGWEETFDGDDYLIYGLGKEWLMEHPEAARWSRREQFLAVREAGGCVVHAHPFRQHYYIRSITLAPALVDAVEAANAGNHEQYYDALALRYAKKLGLPVTAGSDVHDTVQLAAGDVFGVYLNKKMETIADYAAAIRGNAIAGLKMPHGRCDSRGDEKAVLPVDILDAEERSAAQDLWDFLKN
ncbi:hypothetical protein FACS1894110_09480 [Spirochaetia bacterium]|nr:hypothetical protein FACS1894110_09480 [Spirochaetia bacterium]